MKFTRFTHEEDRFLGRLAGAVILMNLLLLGGMLWLALPFLRENITHLQVVIAGIVILVVAQAVFLYRLTSRLSVLRQQKQRAALEEVFLDALLHDTQDAIYLKDREHRVVLANDWMPRNMGIPMEAVLGRTDYELFGEEFGAETAQEEDEIYASGEPMVNAVESRNLETGLLNWTLTTKVPVRVDGEVRAILGITRDFGEIARAQETLEHSAAHDSLTGLLNRYGITRALEHTLKAGLPLALLFVDVDDFKQYNDTRGHDHGDAVLKAVGQRLETVLRKDDRIGRYAGDEFIVLAQRVEAEAEAKVVAAKVFDAFEQPILVEGELCQVSLSIGVSCCQKFDAAQEHLLAEHLIHAADHAMYQVKQSGKHGTQFAAM